MHTKEMDTMDFPIPVWLGTFKEVTVWAVYHWRPAGPTTLGAQGVGTPVVHALFSDDRCYCGLCTLVPGNVGPCPNLERRALLAHDQFRELYSDYSVQLGQFPVLGYLSLGARRIEVVARLLNLAPED
ncbi:hypothetical protein [Actinokineospora enzanensis]|uniref:hypothetical protein n=1 Tax=Actinokineospora enzanensis TaxID=155975 RepID=UPI00039F66DA|nr:hypothetical protein [Actinokineospora enzanensis]